jgi:hypothetical protein
VLRAGLYSRPPQFVICADGPPLVGLSSGRGFGWFALCVYKWLYVLTRAAVRTRWRDSNMVATEITLCVVL